MEVIAACHLHSAWSYDGSWPIEKMADAFSRRGYRVMMMTEHENGFTQARFAEFRDECERVTSEKSDPTPAPCGGSVVAVVDMVLSIGS